MDVAMQVTGGTLRGRGPCLRLVGISRRPTCWSIRGPRVSVGLSGAQPEHCAAEVGSFLIQPPGNAYSGFNISIHGIHPSMTQNSPTFAEIWPMLADRIGGRAVVAHNASFDVSVLRHELDHLGLSYPDLEYYCTLVLSRACWPRLYSHRLPDLSLDELVRKLMGDEHADVLRESLAWFVSELMEAEVMQQIGAGLHE